MPVTSSARHVLTAEQFERPWLESLFRRAEEFDEPAAEAQGDVAGKTLFNIFYEPSTRTRMSFTVAAARLGMKVVSTENARDFSSAAKGETLEDTVRVFNEYHPDVIVLRHFETGSAAKAAEVSQVPIINAGDGKGQHPTQALLDLYTVERELGTVDGSTVVIGGDLAHGRTAKSLACLLTKYQDVRVIFVSPEQLRIGDELKSRLGGLRIEETDRLDDALPLADVVYWTRIQRERFEDPALFDKVKDRYVVGPEELGRMKPKSVLLHPLPRLNEINPSVDVDPRAAYFRQAGNGVGIRMALIEWVLGSDRIST